MSIVESRNTLSSMQENHVVSFALYNRSSADKKCHLLLRESLQWLDDLVLMVLTTLGQ
jgi:hypothetical protein